MDPDKTIKIDSSGQVYDYGSCPVCCQPLKPDTEKTGLLRCQACGHSEKTTANIAAGSIVGQKYRILSLLTNGGSGSIYLCHPLDDPAKRYVLKVLSHPSKISRKRFLREAQILSSITGNSRIASIIDYWAEGDDTCIVMEYVNGKNLKQLYSASALDEENVLIIAYEVTRALQDIWNKFSIVHRDIKPENIMIDDAGYIKLLDFGLSKRCGGSDNECSTITIVSTALGTPGYMSPEHFKDFKHIDFRSDIYSLGATLYYLLTLNRISPGGRVNDFYAYMIKNSPPSPASFAGRCSAGCIAMIRKMMEHDPGKRHRSYEELIADIRTLLHD